MFLHKQILSFFLFLLTLPVFGQFNLSGVVKDNQGNPLPTAHLALTELNQIIVADTEGQYLFTDIPSGNYTLQVSLLGFRSFIKNISLTNHTHLPIVLQEDIATLGEVQIQAKSETREISEQAFQATALNLANAQTSASDISRLLNSTSGVRIRSNGGLGSNTNINLNGFEGKAIRIFRDGIPVDYLGNSFNLSLIPVNSLERVEIYKGAMPVELGADALGGGINFITKKLHKNQLDISYELSSFNTHKTTLNAYLTQKHWFGGFNGFFNYSDNSYKTDVQNARDINDQPLNGSFRRFHDGVRQFYGEGFLGVRDQRWADELILTIGYNDYFKEYQHADQNFLRPFGRVTGTEKGWISSLKYHKNLSKKLSLQLFGSYSHFTNTDTDTSAVIYDWRGDFRPSALSNERLGRASMAKVDFTNYLTRINLTYQFTPVHSLTLNYVYTYHQRKGTDPVGTKIIHTDTDVLTIPADYGKQVAGLSFKSKILSEKLTNFLNAKYYIYQAGGFNNNFVAESDQASQTKGNQWGWGDALKFVINTRLFLRASYEYAMRLPDRYELMGNGGYIHGNFNLKPEISHNFNVGGKYALPLSAQRELTIELNTFYRKTQDIIYLQRFPFFLQYVNYDNAKGWGTELDLTWQPVQGLSLGGNLTYQEIRRTEIADANLRFLEKARIPNQPYFFGNIYARYTFKNALAEGNTLQLYSYYNYVGHFYNEAIPQSKEPDYFWQKPQLDNEQLLIPTQSQIDVGCVYILKNNLVSVGGEIRNITDEKVYDNFRIQRLGRHYGVKIKYLIQ